MSTRYYRLSSPVTYLDIRYPGPMSRSYARILVFIADILSGELTVPSGMVGQVLLHLFAEHEADGKCPLQTLWGGEEQGTVVLVNDNTLSDEEVVISENGELFTVGEVKAMSGGGKEKTWERTN